MSGRIRTVKPEWLEDELLAATSDSARMLSVGLILLADDYGNGRASVATLAAVVWRFELERDDGANAPAVLAKASGAFRELLGIGFIGVWTEGGQRYFAIRNWARHQRVDKPGKALVPAPPKDVFFAEVEDSRIAREVIARPSGTIRDSLRPDLDQRPGPTTYELEPTIARAPVRPVPPTEPAMLAPAPAPKPEKSAAAAAPVAKSVEEKPEQLPNNLEQALEWPICARADVAVAHPERAEWLQPQKWPEVLRVATALHEACGLGDVRLSVYARDSGVRAIVELFAAGYMPSDLVKAARLLPGDPWWSKDGAKRGLASLSAEVVRRVLATGLSPAQEARVARALGDRSPTQAPSLLANVLPKIAGGEP